MLPTARDANLIATVSATPEAPGTATVIATDNKFNRGSVGGAVTGAPFTVTFKNNGKVPHNIHFLDKKGGSDVAKGAAGAIINGGESATLTFTVAAAGNYYYQCDVHPDQMSGTLTVNDGAK